MPYDDIDTDTLAQMVESCAETLGELETQHRSECAFAGDSWPGAQIQIQDTKDSLDRMATELRFRQSWEPAVEIVWDDIPF